MTANSKNKIIYVLLIAIVAFVIIYTVLLPYLNEINKIGKEAMGVDNIEKKEVIFTNKPNVRLAFELMDKYKHVGLVQNNEKAIFYGTKAIELGANETWCGFFVNIWLASLYHNKGNNKLACNFYNKAIKLQNEKNSINYKILHDEGLDNNFIKKCQDERDRIGEEEGSHLKGEEEGERGRILNIQY